VRGTFELATSRIGRSAVQIAVGAVVLYDLRGDYSTSEGAI
jgi:hypothetical protein